MSRFEPFLANGSKRLKRAQHPVAAVLSHPGREKYSQLRAEGFKGAKAAKLCRVSKNTAYRWDADGQVKARIAFLTGPSLREKRGASKSGVRPITFDRNDLIMELWEIGTKGDSMLFRQLSE